MAFLDMAAETYGVGDKQLGLWVEFKEWIHALGCINLFFCGYSGGGR